MEQSRECIKEILQWQLIEKEGRYYLPFLNSPLYSERGVAREIQLLSSLRKENSGKLIYAGPYHAKWIEAESYFEAWIPIGGSYETEGTKIIVSVDQWIDFLHSIRPEDSLTVVLHPSIPPSTYRDTIENCLRHSLAYAAGRLKTLRHFSKTWQYNARRNAEQWKAFTFPEKLEKPNYFILGGPQVDNALRNIPSGAVLWVADTALYPVLHRGFSVSLVVSVDAGFASREHFLGIPRKDLSKLDIFVDFLSHPAVLALPFRKKYSYSSSHPLTPKSLPALVNGSGDVKGIMTALFSKLFPEKELPKLIGGTGLHSGLVSHLRGSAYHRRMATQANRFITAENYFRILSQRYR